MEKKITVHLKQEKMFQLRRNLRLEKEYVQYMMYITSTGSHWHRA